VAYAGRDCCSICGIHDLNQEPCLNWKKIKFYTRLRGASSGFWNRERQELFLLVLDGKPVHQREERVTVSFLSKNTSQCLPLELETAQFDPWSRALTTKPPFKFLVFLYKEWGRHNPMLLHKQRSSNIKAEKETWRPPLCWRFVLLGLLPFLT